MKILISAAEASSDVHGAHLVQALRQLIPKNEPLKVFGMGGPALKQQGLHTLVDARALLAMGLVEILRYLPRVFRALRILVRASEKLRPDVIVVLDYPDFHFRLAKRLKKLGIPIIYYIPPKTWVWRQKRIAFLKQYFSKILCIFPFEKKFYQSYQLRVTYVGNPLIDELPWDCSRAQARERFNLQEHDCVLTVMPGSRPSELKRHLKFSLTVAQQVSQKLRQVHFLKPFERLKVIIPIAETLSFDQVLRQVQCWEQEFDACQIQLFTGQASFTLIAANVGLIKSGTSTLEAALMQCPHVIFYKIHPITQWIFDHCIRYRGPIGLVNWISGCKTRESYLVQEWIGRQATVQALSDALIELLLEPKKQKNQQEGFQKVLQQMRQQGVSPSIQAAQEILSFRKCISSC